MTNIKPEMVTVSSLFEPHLIVPRLVPFDFGNSGGHVRKRLFRVRLDYIHSVEANIAMHGVLYSMPILAMQCEISTHVRHAGMKLTIPWKIFFLYWQ